MRLCLHLSYTGRYPVASALTLLLFPSDLVVLVQLETMNIPNREKEREPKTVCIDRITGRGRGRDQNVTSQFGNLMQDGYLLEDVKVTKTDALVTAK